MSEKIMSCSLAWCVCCLWNEQSVKAKISMCSEVDSLFTYPCLLKYCPKNCWFGVMVVVCCDFVCKELKIGNSKDNEGAFLLALSLFSQFTA